MLRTALGRVSTVVRSSVGLTSRVTAVRASHGGPVESDAEFDARYVAYFSRSNIDGWEVRKGMNDLLGMDLIPDPTIISAGLKACRKVNDYALAIRWLEGCHDKCGDRKDLYSYLIKEIRPTLDELGVSTPEELGYDTPELALKSVFD